MNSKSCYPWLFQSLILSSLLVVFSKDASAWRCRENKVDLLLIGDSQTGTVGSQSYFGNHVRHCLNHKKVNFVSYARGSTRPEHWLYSDDLDQVTTIRRDPQNEEVNVGWGAMVPECKRRLEPMLKAHQPKKVLAFFGDNFLLHPAENIAKQSQDLVKVIRAHGISFEDCYFLTATYEMQVPATPRFPHKTLKNTLDVDLAIRQAIGDQCQVIDGLELMSDSPLLVDSKLMRVQSNGQRDCFGKAENDNIHYCGDAAQELAEKVCERLN
jgi:hypothetical protein